MSMPEIRYRIFGRDGTVDHLEMRDLIRSGEVTSLSDIAREDSEEWQAAGNYAELQRYFALAAAHGRRVSRPSSGFNPTRTIGTIMILLGFLFAISYLGDFFSGIASSHWPTAEARLIYTQVIDDAPWWWSFVFARRHSNRTAHAWRLYVGYEYFVNGQKYHSNGIAFGGELDSAVYQRERFRYAKPLLAYYDPDAPARAVLDPGITLGSVWTTLGGVIVLLLGVVIFASSVSGTVSRARSAGE